MKISKFIISIVFLIALTTSSHAETTVTPEVGFVLNTLLFLMGGFLVMWMAAGFCMLESGLVTSKSVSVICAKNIGLYSIAGIMFWLFGYNLAYGIPEPEQEHSADLDYDGVFGDSLDIEYRVETQG